MKDRMKNSSLTIKEQMGSLQEEQTELKIMNGELSSLLDETYDNPNLAGPVKSRLKKVRGQMMRNRLGPNGLRSLSNTLKNTRTDI